MEGVATRESRGRGDELGDEYPMGPPVARDFYWPRCLRGRMQCSRCLGSEVSALALPLKKCVGVMAGAESPGTASNPIKLRLYSRSQDLPTRV